MGRWGLSCGRGRGVRWDDREDRAEVDKRVRQTAFGFGKLGILRGRSACNGRQTFCGGTEALSHRFGVRCGLDEVVRSEKGQKDAAENVWGEADLLFGRLSSALFEDRRAWVGSEEGHTGDSKRQYGPDPAQYRIVALQYILYTVTVFS